MSRLTDLIAKVKASDQQLGADMEREFRALSSRLSFGLNFERHRPEAVELPQRPVRRGDKVRVLPPRGSMARGDQRLWQVKAIHKAKKTADLELLDQTKAETQSVALDDLVVIAEFRDTIYPGLVSTGRVSRGCDKPWHTVINGENYHALKALTWTHRGKVDAIYIDPPYNSGAKDWKYNNDYVAADDLYRHSKWLAMMERRLLLAKELLNPVDSVMIVTIDEKEYLRLGLLLEQLFPDGKIQMVSIVTNRKGNPRRGEFSRCEEYIYFVRFGDAGVYPWSSDMLHESDEISSDFVRWKSLLRLASTGQTEGRFNLFYPLFFDAETRKFLRPGEPIPDGIDSESVEVPEGESVLWPICKDGRDGRWSLSLGKFKDYFEKGYVKFGKKNGGGRTPYYLMSGQLEDIESGDLQIVGHDEDGAVILRKITDLSQPMTIWNRRSHSTSGHGTTLLGDVVPNRKFPYPKSLYAVEDAVRFFVKEKPEAVILDFFSGSGTTAHAVMRLNKEDGGRRQCISVTNNEVSAVEQRRLREQNLRAGDPEWEKLGICDFVTKPRVEAAITGKTLDGEPIKGNYEVGKTVEKEKPRSFKQIGFTESNDFDSEMKKRQLVALVKRLPQNLVTGTCPFIVNEEHTSSILFDTKSADDWLEALDGQDHIMDFYIVTPVKRTFDFLKRQVTELLGPSIVKEVEKLPISDGFEENAEFFTLTYETPLAVSYQTAFERIAPLLWLRAGSAGRRIEKLPAAGWDVADAYGLLVELDKATDFLKATRKARSLRIAYIVTDDERRFQALARRLPEGVEAIRLYESYLTNFAFANGDDR
jgi:adenine-specific DNA-methyltransferase